MSTEVSLGIIVFRDLLECTHIAYPEQSKKKKKHASQLAVARVDEHGSDEEHRSFRQFISLLVAFSSRQAF